MACAEFSGAFRYAQGGRGIGIARAKCPLPARVANACERSEKVRDAISPDFVRTLSVWRDYASESARLASHPTHAYTHPRGARASPSA
jgi:hypothetical protein